MHELVVTKNIFQIVQAYAEKHQVKKVLKVNLDIGVLSDLQEEWLQNYFNRLSQGSVADGAKLQVNKIPANVRCDDCLHTFEIESLVQDDLLCPNCQSRAISLMSGREYHIQNIEVI